MVGLGRVEVGEEWERDGGERRDEKEREEKRKEKKDLGQKN